MADRILSLLLSLPGLLIALSMHEFAHGYAAYIMGDRTAELDGRLSIRRTMPFALPLWLGKACTHKPLQLP